MDELELPQNYSGEDSTTDYTDSLKKIWDLRIPKKNPKVLSFDTIKAIYNEHKKIMGPYHHWEDKLFFRCKVTIPIEPLKEVGFQEGDKITVELFKKAYGDIDSDLKYEMIGLARFMGLNISQFDLEGNITYYFE